MPASSAIPSFLRDGGETGRLIAAHDWSATSLGSIANWPQSLRTAVALLLRSPVPIVMLWGEDGVMLYNDAYSVFAGARHPRLLGCKVREGWPEVADFNDKVMRVGLGGGTLAYRDQELILYRHGSAERVWMNLDYSPVIDESGEPAGVIAIVVETTERVLADRRAAFLAQLSERLRSLGDPRAVLAASAQLLGEHLGVDRVGYGEVEGEGEDVVVHVERDWRLGDAASVAGRHRLVSASIRSDIDAGRPIVVADAAADPRTREGPAAENMARFGIGAQIVVPLLRDGRTSGILFVHSRAPHAWSDEEVALVRDVAERSWSSFGRALAEQALRDNEERMRLALVAGGFTDWYWDRASDRIRFSPRAADRLRIPDGFHPSSADIAALVPEEERAGVIAAGERAIETGEPYQIEYRMRRPDGSLAWIATYGQPVRDESGNVAGVIGISQEITQRRHSEEALRKSEESLRLAIEGAGMATWETDLDTRHGRWSGTRFDILGYERPDDLCGTVDDWLRLIHEEDRPRVEAAVELCFAEGKPFTLEYRFRRADNGEERWLHSYGNRIVPHPGEKPRFVGISFDITRQKRSEQHQTLLIHELNHRVKNTLAIVQAIAQQSFKSEPLSAEARAAFEARLAALSAAHNLLTRQNWEGASIRQVIDDGLAAYQAGGRIHVDGPDLPLAPKPAVSLAMAVHELATNAVKYGALSNGGGRVDIAWSIADGRFRWTWRESGGPPVSQPSRRGFGSRMIERGLAAELRGEARLGFEPGGLICTLTSPFPIAERDS